MNTFFIFFPDITTKKAAPRGKLDISPKLVEVFNKLVCSLLLHKLYTHQCLFTRKHEQSGISKIKLCTVRHQASQIC